VKLASRIDAEANDSELLSVYSTLIFLSTSNLIENEGYVDLTRGFHEEFTLYMKMLNVLEPDIGMKTSSYTEEIVQFIQKMIDIGYTCELDSSIYFNILKFTQPHDYSNFAKLKFDNLIGQGK
jgi:cysteinyl-tRNA synthetase